MSINRDSSKLPKWAQDKFDQLEMRLEEAQRELADLKSGRPESPVQVEGLGGGFGLDEHTSVRFRLGDATRDDGKPRYFIDVRRRDGVVEVYGSDPLMVRQHSSNVFAVDVVDRYEQRDDVSIRNLGQRVMEELKARGLWYQDGLNLIYDCNPEEVIAARDRTRRPTR